MTRERLWWRQVERMAPGSSIASRYLQTQRPDRPDCAKPDRSWARSICSRTTCASESSVVTTRVAALRKSSERPSSTSGMVTSNVPRTVANRTLSCRIAEAQSSMANEIRPRACPLSLMVLYDKRSTPRSASVQSSAHSDHCVPRQTS